MQNRKSKKSNKCVNCTELSFGDGRTSALEAEGVGVGWLGWGCGGLDCCDMQNAASLQNFCSVLAPGKFPVPWLTQKVQLFKAFQSCVSKLQGVSTLTSTEFRNGGITGIFLSNLHGTDVKPPTVRTAHQWQEVINLSRWQPNREPPRTRNKLQFLQLLLTTDPPIKKFIFITESSTSADATEPWLHQDGVSANSAECLDSGMVDPHLSASCRDHKLFATRARRRADELTISKYDSCTWPHTLGILIWIQS